MFSESSTIVMQLPFCPGKQGELPEIFLQNLRNDLMADSARDSAVQISLQEVALLPLAAAMHFTQPLRGKYAQKMPL